MSLSAALPLVEMFSHTSHATTLAPLAWRSARQTSSSSCRPSAATFTRCSVGICAAVVVTSKVRLPFVNANPPAPFPPSDWHWRLPGRLEPVHQRHCAQRALPGRQHACAAGAHPRRPDGVPGLVADHPAGAVAVVGPLWPGWLRLGAWGLGLGAWGLGLRLPCAAGCHGLACFRIRR